MRTQFDPEYERDYPATVKLVHDAEVFEALLLQVRDSVLSLHSDFPMEFDMLPQKIKKALLRISEIS
jgi:hypothetical protein